MIAPFPECALRLIVTHAANDTAASAPATTSGGADGALLRTLVNAGRAQGYSSDFIVDALDRRIKAYIAKVGNRGEGDRDNTAYRIARWLLNDFGTSEAVAWAYLAEWNQGNSPPYPERELQRKLVSARRSGRRPAGCAHNPRGTAA